MPCLTAPSATKSRSRNFDWSPHSILTALSGPYIGRPLALDVRQDGSDFPVRQSSSKGGHIRPISLGVRGGTELGYPHQKCIRMVPRMAGGVVRWRRQSTVRKATLPVRLPLQRHAMAARASSYIQSSTLVDLLSVCRVDARDVTREEIVRRTDSDQHQPDSQHDERCLLSSQEWRLHASDTPTPGFVSEFAVLGHDPTYRRPDATVVASDRRCSNTTRRSPYGFLCRSLCRP